MNTIAASGPRTLIADDQPDILAALSLLLKGAGHRTEAVRSPAAVIEALKKQDFDVLLMDLNYSRDTTSGQEGLDLLSHIRKVDKTLPVVVMTAWANLDLALEAMRQGVGDFVQKPWENRRLLKILETQIDKGRARRMRWKLRAKRRILNDKLRRELEDASEIQAALLPKTIPHLNGMEVSAGWWPAGAVSGDYFDVLKFSECQIGICIADVAGKGLPAALLMSNLQATLKSCASSDVKPSEVCTRVNSIICGNTLDRQFITFFYGLLDPQRHAFVYSNAGHNPPLLIRCNGEWLRLAEAGAVLGVVPKHKYVERALELISGDRLVLFTDGFTEARNGRGEEFGEERLRELLITHRQLSAVELQAKAIETVATFCAGEFFDDVTLIVVAVE